jgi:hypothetical protein
MRRYPDGEWQTSVGVHSGRKCGRSPKGHARHIWFNHLPLGESQKPRLHIGRKQQFGTLCQGRFGVFAS